MDMISVQNNLCSDRQLLLEWLLMIKPTSCDKEPFVFAWSGLCDRRQNTHILPLQMHVL